MIVFVQFNPRVEKIVSLSKMRLGGHNQAAVLRCYAEGKGIQASMAVKQLGGEPFLMGFNYAINGRVITAALEQAGILYDLVTVPGELCTTLKIWEEQTGAETVLQVPEGFVPAEAIRDLLFRILRRADDHTIVVLSGSVPQGVPKNICASIIRDLQPCGARVILDTSEILLEDGIEAGPWMIKISLEGMESLFGRNYQREIQVVEDARKLAARGVPLVCVSMGALGALLVDRDSIWKSHPIPDLPMKEERGIGAAMVAGICLAAEKGNSPQDMLRCGIAAAGAAVSQEQNQLCSRLDFEQVLPQVSIQAL